jgi:hypothetical protein
MNLLDLRWPVVARRTALILALLTLSTLPSLAQSTASGTITGTVTDPTGAVLPGTTVAATDPATKQKLTVVSNKNGEFVLSDVPPGVYNVTATKSGFSVDEIPGLVVSIGTQTTANFKMAVGAETTTVEVTASSADLQTMNASTGTTVDPEMVGSLPTIGREVASFMTMQPGVTPGGNVAGTTVDQATFTLDGGSNSSDMDGTASVYTTSYATSTTGGFIAAGPQGTMPMPQDSVEEFKVTTTGQTAEFNNSSGSQSLVVTKRGHDKWHGSAYEYYLDNNFDANSWQNNFPNATFAATTTTPVVPTGSTSYTAKPSYHFSRFGGTFGGPVAPYKFGGKTYFFANYEGFRYPLAATYERTVPSYEYLQLGQLTFGGTTYSAAQLAAADPRGLGQNPTLANFYKTKLPVAAAGDGGSTGFTGTKYAGSFDSSCGALSTSYCDSVNTIGYKANILTPQSSDFLASRLDHDFGPKWHFMASYRYYRLINLTSNQVDIGGAAPGDTVGTPKALAPRPQQPMFIVFGLTTNISPSLTNDLHYSFLKNFWQWKGLGAPPADQGFPNAGGVVEPLGENGATTVLAPFNVNAQSIRTRIWDGKDNFLSDNLSKLKGDHLIQFGGQFQHNTNYHQRTDNGAGINYTPTYQLGDPGGGGNVVYAGTAGSTACATPGAGLGCVGANANVNYARILDTYYGIVTDTQVANTYTNAGGVLSLNPPATPISATTHVPYYNIYVTDTWHVMPSLTVNYGLSYAIEMPPTESNGNQVMFTDATGNAIYLDHYLALRKTAALSGQVYNPEIGFALIKNVVGNRKYAYDPFYGGLSPRVSFAWNPKFTTPALSTLFGDGATVFRAGYSRIYGRINGDVETLNPILSPGLILATQCKAVQNNGTAVGTCSPTGVTDSTVYRFGTDGQSPLTAAAAPPSTLPQPYHPGFDGPGVALASPVDPSLRPNDVDTFNVSIQRQVNRKMLVEAGYIGRLIHHEYIMKNPNVIPYMMTLGGQSFESAYIAIEGAFGCTSSATACAKSTTPYQTITMQPFFEAALAGTGYCTATAKQQAAGINFANCTQAVVYNQAASFRAQKVFSIWQALDSTAGTTGFNFSRSLMGTATSNATYGSAGQVVTGLSMGTADGFSNYNGGYISFKITDFHGLTAQENLTYSKALGLGAYNQSTSSEAAEDSYNLYQQYGRQSFDQKVIFNTFIVYRTPWYKDQNGIVGRLAGGWTLSPVLTAGTGQPLTCASNNSGQNFGGEDGSNFTDTENCIFTQPYTGGYHTHRGVIGGADTTGGYSVNVGTAVHPGNIASSAVNMFTNPVAVWQTVRPPILGLDTRDSGYGPISGLPYLNLDLSVKKNLVVFEKYSVELSGVLFNALNHMDFASPSLSLASSTSFGVTKTQGNTPRQIQMGARVSF